MKQVFVQNYDDSSLDYEYDIFENDLTTTLVTSNNHSWVESHREQEVAKMVNTGNGLEIKLNDQKPIKLTYSQSLELLVLLSAQNNSRIEIRESSLFKVIL